jgi:hypothetical protein
LLLLLLLLLMEMRLRDTQQILLSLTSVLITAPVPTILPVQALLRQDRIRKCRVLSLECLGIHTTAEIQMAASASAALAVVGSVYSTTVGEDMC